MDGVRKMAYRSGSSGRGCGARQLADDGTGRLHGDGRCMRAGRREDACVLAEELRAAATVESALASYVSRRKDRVEWVQHQSMAVGESLIIPSAVRNAMLRQRGNEAMHARFGPLVSAP